MGQGSGRKSPARPGSCRHFPWREGVTGGAGEVGSMALACTALGKGSLGALGGGILPGGWPQVLGAPVASVDMDLSHPPPRRWNKISPRPFRPRCSWLSQCCARGTELLHVTKTQSSPHPLLPQTLCQKRAHILPPGLCIPPHLSVQEAARKLLGLVPFGGARYFYREQFLTIFLVTQGGCY